MRPAATASSIIRRTASTALVAACVIALAACATPRTPGGAATPAATISPSATTAPTPTPVPSPSEPSPTPESTAGTTLPTIDTIDCDAMLDPAVDADLRRQGMSPAPKPWTQFQFTPTEASIECPWGLPGDMAARQYYAWTALAPGERDTVLQLAVDNGYTLTDTAEGTWLTYGAEDGAAGDGPMELSGMLLTDSWFAIADTPDQVRQIVWTR
ncbi:hypothetical protein ABC304_05940 [Microbacterium sp. 1P10UB]|uniref:hypothetical protein n=1 Tax=unclassified Microbacterium TaxID=2609290 RepID=UPI00399F1F56